MKPHHVGYLTRNMDRAIALFQELGYRIEEAPAPDEGRGITIAFLVNEGLRVELIEPVSEDSPMYPLLKRYKNTPYHICYETEDLEGKIEELCRGGYTVFQAPAPAPCIEGRRVAFLLHTGMGIIELLET